MKSCVLLLFVQSVSNRLSATVADLHTVKKAMEETDTRARAEKVLFEEQTASFEQRISQLSQRLDSLLKQYQVSGSLFLSLLPLLADQVSSQALW